MIYFYLHVYTNIYVFPDPLGCYDIQVKTQGFNSGITPTLNAVTVTVDGTEIYSSTDRGLHFIAVNADTGEMRWSHVRTNLTSSYGNTIHTLSFNIMF